MGTRIFRTAFIKIISLRKNNPTQSCTSGRAGGLICEPLKAVWPAYAGIVTRIFLVDRASYLLSLVPLCTLESALHPAPPLTRNSPSPKSSVPHKVLRPIHEPSCDRNGTLALDKPHHPRRPSTSVVSTTACEHGQPSDAPPPLRSLSAELNPG